MVRMNFNLKRTRFPDNGHVGRKTKFLPDMLHEVECLSRLGATNEEIARFYQVDLGTIEVWLRNNPEFYEARKKGGIIADNKIATSLYRNAKGYEYTRVETTYDANGLATGSKRITADVRGDTTAQIFWLTNRQPDYWKHMNRIQHEHSGDVRHSHYHQMQDIPIEELSKETQKMLFEVNMKQLSDGRGN
jgi:hypothetical protein